MLITRKCLMDIELDFRSLILSERFLVTIYFIVHLPFVRYMLALLFMNCNNYDSDYLSLSYAHNTSIFCCNISHRLNYPDFYSCSHIILIIRHNVQISPPQCNTPLFHCSTYIIFHKDCILCIFLNEVIRLFLNIILKYSKQQKHCCDNYASNNKHVSHCTCTLTMAILYTIYVLYYVSRFSMSHPVIIVLYMYNLSRPYLLTNFNPPHTLCNNVMFLIIIIDHAMISRTIISYDLVYMIIIYKHCYFLYLFYPLCDINIMYNYFRQAICITIYTCTCICIKSIFTHIEFHACTRINITHTPIMWKSRSHNHVIFTIQSCNHVTNYIKQSLNHVIFTIHLQHNHHTYNHHTYNHHTLMRQSSVTVTFCHCHIIILILIKMAESIISLDICIYHCHYSYVKYCICCIIVYIN